MANLYILVDVLWKILACKCLIFSNLELLPVWDSQHSTLKKLFKQKRNFLASSKQVSTKSSPINRNCENRSLIQLSLLLNEVKIDILTINQALLLLAQTFHSMPKNTDIQTHCIDVQSAVEIDSTIKRSSQKRNQYHGKFFFNCQTLQIFGGI